MSSSFVAFLDWIVREATLLSTSQYIYIYSRIACLAQAIFSSLLILETFFLFSFMLYTSHWTSLDDDCKQHESKDVKKRAPDTQYMMEHSVRAVVITSSLSHLILYIYFCSISLLRLHKIGRREKERWILLLLCIGRNTVIEILENIIFSR